MVPPKSALDSFLQFLYCDNTEMPVPDAVYLLPMSDFFGLSNKKLREHCVRIIEQGLSPSNLLECLESADAINSLDLKEMFLAEIVSKFTEVMESKYIDQLDKKLLVEILRSLAAYQKSSVPNKA
jgi:hypothetical protein